MLTSKCLGVTRTPTDTSPVQVSIFSLFFKMMEAKIHLNLQLYEAYSVCMTVTKPNPKAVTTCGAKEPFVINSLSKMTPIM